MAVVIKLLGTVHGDPTSFDGKYVVSYDPSAWRYRLVSSIEEIEELYATFLTVTDDPAAARVFPSLAEAREFWMQTGVGIRPDGKPNRPMTAFHIEISPA